MLSSASKNELWVLTPSRIVTRTWFAASTTATNATKTPLRVNSLVGCSDVQSASSCHCEAASLTSTNTCST